MPRKHIVNLISIGPENMGLDTLFVQLYAILADIQGKIEFSIKAALICIKMIRGICC